MESNDNGNTEITFSRLDQEELFSKDVEKSNMTDSLEAKNRNLSTTLFPLQQELAENRGCLWTRFLGRSYYFSPQRMNWVQSRDYCRSKGGNLVIIKSEEKQRFLQTHIGETHWIGLSDLGTEGEWYWVDDTRLSQPHSPATGPPCTSTDYEFASSIGTVLSVCLSFVWLDLHVWTLLVLTTLLGFVPNKALTGLYPTIVSELCILGPTPTHLPQSVYEWVERIINCTVLWIKERKTLGTLVNLSSSGQCAKIPLWAQRQLIQMIRGEHSKLRPL
ncbi:uncharacterized protein LOC133123086 isoform X2 [Conger conger]|uniref:uncharacterized protein LOC133123086 isoform X2 n=1 Tax=Conger conger TaxID=82655 RepID=UPI002A59EC39|nr:uncharacterized protein LOC133123086 isoform X2 [Conger conger]